MIDFLVLLFIFVAGCMILQSLSYRFAKRNLHKYKETKLMHMWLDMHVQKGPKLDGSDYTFILIVCIIWKIWFLPLVK
ncbi:hypothetical protein [Bacillus mycoides]|uniref:hypothetical protein n=1 Tax=Bacillus mycoides TaxID=1405 RepID=UPI00119FD98B|nr:hypothetical protein [Bacillus mycoides]